MDRVSTVGSGAAAGRHPGDAATAWNDALRDSQAGAPAPSGDLGTVAHVVAPGGATHVVAPGETLGALSARYGTPVDDIVRSNPTLRDADHVRAGQVLTIPLETNGATPPRLDVVHAGETLGGVAARNGTTVRRLAAANGLDDPDRIRAGQHIWVPGSRGLAARRAPSAPAVIPPGGGTAAEGGSVPREARLTSGSTAPAAPAIAAPGATSGRAQAILARAQAEADPGKALRALSDGYASAPHDVRAAVLASPGAGEVLAHAAAWADEPLTGSGGGAVFPQARAAAALRRLDHVTLGVDAALAGGVAARAVPGYEAFARDPRQAGQPPFGAEGVATLMTVSGRVAGTAPGDAAISRFAGLGAWNRDAVRNSLAAGADPAYPLALAAYMAAQGQDPQGVTDVIGEGVAGFQQTVAGDVEALAKHDAELAWLVQKDGAGLSPGQLGQAVAAYRAKQGPAWEHEEAGLRGRIAGDGAKLLAQMTALHGAAPGIPSAGFGDTLRAVANDPATGLAISTAIRTDPALAEPHTAQDLANVFASPKVGDIGRKFINELGVAYVRQNVLAKLQGTDLADPASVARARQAIGGLSSEGFARLIGVAPDDTKKAVQALQDAVEQAAAHPDGAAGALNALDTRLNRDPTLARAFNKTTLPGQLLRGVGVAFAGAGVINSGAKAAASPDAQNRVKLLVDAAGFAQKSTDLLVGLGRVSDETAAGRALRGFGGEWTLGRRRRATLSAASRPCSTGSARCDRASASACRKTAGRPGSRPRRRSAAG
jgi:LysM repeat protein